MQMQGGKATILMEPEQKKKERKEKRKKIHLGRGRDAAVCCHHGRCPSLCPTPAPRRHRSMFPSPRAIACGRVCSCLSSRRRCCTCFLSHPRPRCSHFHPTTSCSRQRSGVMWWWGWLSSSLSSPGCCGCHMVGVLGGPHLCWCPCSISSFPLPCRCCCCCPARVSTLQAVARGSGGGCRCSGGGGCGGRYLVILFPSSFGSVLAPTIHPASSGSQQ